MSSSERIHTSAGVRWQLIGCLVGLLILAACSQIVWASSMEDSQSDLQLETIASRTLLPCPSGISAVEPNRRVLQVIEMTIHRWAEYDLDEGRAMCIVLERPEARLLDVGEALDLLHRSRAWEAPLPEFEHWERLPSDAWQLQAPAPVLDFTQPPSGEFSVDARLPDTEYVPGERETSVGIGSESGDPRSLSEIATRVVIGDDDERLRRSLSHVQNHPWNTIGFFLHQYPFGTIARCTAFLVGPYLALTNGHCVYNDERNNRGGTIRAGELAPGQFSAGQGEEVIRPFGNHPVYRVRLNNGWVNDESAWHYDYAGLNLSRPFSDITTFMPLVFEDPGAQTLNTSGYPRDVFVDTEDQESPSHAQWWSSSEETSIGGTNDRLMYHDADTSGGHSGSPLWRFISPDRRVVAIHCCGSDDLEINWGPRLVSQNQGLIENWLGWQPPATPPAADDFGEVELYDRGRGMFLANNTGATRQVAEHNHCGNDDAARSLWWHWVPPVHNRTINVTATSSDMDLVLAVYRGPRVDALAERGCDDTPGGSNTVTFTPTFTQLDQHNVVVAGAQDAEGVFALSWEVEPPANDDFVNRLTLWGADGNRSGDNWGATAEIGEGLHCGNLASTSVWWTYEPQSVPGRLQIDTDGSDFDVVIAVYTGDAVNDLTEQACNADVGSNLAVELNTLPGQSYHVAIAGRSGDQGSIAINYEWEETGVEIFQDRFEETD